MQCFGFGHGVINIVDADYFDLECFFSTEKAVYPDSIFKGEAAGGTGHFLCCFFKARDMEVMSASSCKHGAIGMTQSTFGIFKWYLSPLDIESDDMEGISGVTAA